MKTSRFHKVFPDRTILYLLSIPLLIVTIGCGAALHHFSIHRASLKQDFSQVNSIKYGLLSVDIWRDRIQEIVSGSIGEFRLTWEQEADLKKVISNVLLALVDETDGLLKKRHKSLSATIQKLIVTTFFDVSDLRKKVPQLTQIIIDEIKKPANTVKLKHLARSQLDVYSEQSYDNDNDLSPVNRTLVKHQTSTAAEFNRKILGRIAALEEQSAVCVAAMLASLLLYLFMGWRMWKNPAVHKLLFSFAIGFALVFLITALTIPMMEIDARIKKVDVVLVGKHLVFQDQVLFYRSKSILQVVQSMIDTGELGSAIVGMLILLFSVLFPLAKLISLEWVILAGDKVKRNKWVQFFAFKSGKWSMADVMVLSIFMAYIGFNGVLKNQLDHFNVKTATLESVSTSGTTLQPGCILFLGFVIFGLFLSALWEKTHFAHHPDSQLS